MAVGVQQLAFACNCQQMNKIEQDLTDTELNPRRIFINKLFRKARKCVQNMCSCLGGEAMNELSPACALAGSMAEVELTLQYPEVRLTPLGSE